MEHFSQGSHCRRFVNSSLVCLQPSVQLNENFFNFERFFTGKIARVGSIRAELQWFLYWSNISSNFFSLIFIHKAVVTTSYFRFFFLFKLGLDWVYFELVRTANLFLFSASCILCTAGCYLICMCCTKNIIQELKAIKPITPGFWGRCFPWNLPDPCLEHVYFPQISLASSSEIWKEISNNYWMIAWRAQISYPILSTVIPELNNLDVQIFYGIVFVNKMITKPRSVNIYD